MKKSKLTYQQSLCKCGEEEEVDAATVALRAAIEKEGLEYEVDEGGGAFTDQKLI